jgi:hypothetical protein
VSCPGRFLPQGKNRYPLYRRLGGPQGRSGQVRKISPPTGIRSPDRPACSQSLYRLSYPAHNVWHRQIPKAKIIQLEISFVTQPKKGAHDRSKKECRNNWGWGGALERHRNWTGLAVRWNIYYRYVNGRRLWTKQMLCAQSETMKATYFKSLLTKGAVRKSINPETKHLTYKIKKKVWKIRVCVLYAVSSV